MKKNSFLVALTWTLIFLAGNRDGAAGEYASALPAWSMMPVDAAEYTQDNSALLSPADSDQNPCDAGLTLDSGNPLHAAQAIEICKIAANLDDWGLTTAEWVMADGSIMTTDPDYHLGHGILPGFGANVTVRKGERMLALSSGTARQPTDPGYEAVFTGYIKGYESNYPSGFPVAVPSCSGSCSATASPTHDDAALKVTLRVPPLVDGFSFDFKFYAADYPAYICTHYNDWFIAILDPAPAGQPDGNIALDSTGNPITVNSYNLQVCAAASCYTCPLGTSDLVGTGFEGHGATGWLTASADGVPDTLITLRFAIHDSGDGAFDSTVLIDNFRWHWLPPSLWLPLVSR